MILKLKKGTEKIKFECKTNIQYNKVMKHYIDDGYELDNGIDDNNYNELVLIKDDKITVIGCKDKNHYHKLLSKFISEGYEKYVPTNEKINYNYPFPK